MLTSMWLDLKIWSLLSCEDWSHLCQETGTISVWETGSYPYECICWDLGIQRTGVKKLFSKSSFVCRQGGQQVVVMVWHYPYVSCNTWYAWANQEIYRLFWWMGSLQGMLCSRGQLLLMLDADGATKITDLEKLESQVRVLDVLAQNLLYSFKSI